MPEATSAFQEINRIFDRECRSRVLSQVAEAKGE
jgi:hypothetical protein